jgi:hypothetical protein
LPVLHGSIVEPFAVLAGAGVPPVISPDKR